MFDETGTQGTTDPNLTGSIPDITTAFNKLEEEAKRSLKPINEILNQVNKITIAAESLNKEFIGGRTRVTEMMQAIADVSPEVIGKMRQHLTDHNVVGVTGCRLTDGYYTSAEQVKETTASVDIVTGRLHMCKKKPIIEAFKLRDQLGLKIWREDDILLSLAASGNMVVDAEIWNLDEEHIGLSHEPQHYQERNKVCKTIYESIKKEKHQYT
jgi:hypothetical protein